MNYERKNDWTLSENKPNSKPIKPNQSQCFILIHLAHTPQVDTPTPIINPKTKVRREMNQKKLKNTNFPPFLKCSNSRLCYSTQRIFELSAGRFLRKTQKRFEVTFYPSPVQNDMHNHQNNKQSSQIKMDITPFVPGHRPQVSHLFTGVLITAASTEAPAPTAGRQNVLHNKAGNSQTQQIDKADDINNKI